MNYEQDAKTLIAYVDRLRGAGAAAAQNNSGTPPEDVGVFAGALPEWAAGRTYNKGDLFQYQGAAGFCKQDGVLAQAHQPPFSVGLESVYGARPEPDRDGVYPYTYNMAAKTGMLVREGGAVYECYNGPVPDMLYPPSQLAAHFRAYAPVQE